MTMHISKGLKFPVVFIPGLGHLPNAQGEVADEARLLYVAMTRAIEVRATDGRSQVSVCEAAEGGAGEGGLMMNQTPNTIVKRVDRMRAPLC